MRPSVPACLAVTIGFLTVSSAPAAECTLNLLPTTTGSRLHGELAIGDDSARRIPFVTGEQVAIDGLTCGSTVLIQAGQQQGSVVPFFRVWEQRRVTVDPEVSVTAFPIRSRRPVDLDVRTKTGEPVAGAGVYVRAREDLGAAGGSHRVRTGWEGRSRVYVRNDVVYEIRTLGLDKGDLQVEIDRRPVGPPYLIEAGSNPVSVSIRTAGTARISAVVKTDAGAGVSGIEFEYFFGPERKRFRIGTRTDQGGRLLFSGRAYPVELRAQDPRRRYDFEPSAHVVAGPDEPHDVAFRAVDTGEETLILRFVDPESGEGVEGIHVTLKFEDDGESIDHQFYVPTDEEGEMRATCHVGATLEIDATSRSDNYRRFRHETDVRDCEAMTFELASGITLHGTVVDATGNPVPDLGVSIGNGNHRTDGEGRFSVNALGPGSFTIKLYRIEDVPGPRPIVGIAGPNGEMLPAVVELDPDEAEHSVELIGVDPARACVRAGVPENLAPPPAIAVQAFRPESNVPVKHYSPEPCTARLLPGVYQLLVYDKNGWLVPSWWPGKGSRRDARMVELPEGIDDTLKIAMSAAGKLALTHDFLQERHVWRNTVWRKPPGDEPWTLLRHGVDYRYRKDGPLEIHGLSPGSWRFRLCENEACEGRTWVSPDSIEILALETTAASTLPLE